MMSKKMIRWIEKMFLSKKEVDGLDLRNATHAYAVQTFRNSGDPVKMTIQRQVKRNQTTCEIGTQTFGVMFAVTGEERSTRTTELQNNIKNKANWLTLHDFNEKDSMTQSGLDEPVEIMNKTITEDVNEKDENKSELYDSAYDTLLTQRSSRSTRPSSNDPSDSENGIPETDDCNVATRNASKQDNNEKRHSTFFVIPGDHEPMAGGKHGEVWDDSSAAEDAPEIEYEYEYEEVILQKENGKYGLLLCYGGDATDVAVYVGDMEEDSVADMSGKVMVGDQIVQINGCHVSDVDQAYQMLHDNDEIVVIVARAVYEVQSDIFDDAEETDLDILDSIVEESESNYDMNSNTLKSSVSTSTSLSSTTSATSSRKASVLSNSSTNVQVNTKRSEPSATVVSHNFTTVTASNTDDNLIDSPRMEKSSTIDKNEKDSVKNSLKNFVKNALGGHSEKKEKRNLSNSDESCDLSKCHRSDSTSSSASTRKHSNASSKSQDSLEQLKCRLKEQKQMSKMKAYVDSPSLNRHRNTNFNNHGNQFISPASMATTTPPSFPNINIEYIPAHSVNNPNTNHMHAYNAMTSPSILTAEYNNNNNNNNNNSINLNNNNINRTPRTHVARSTTSSLKSAMKNTGTVKTAKHVQIDPHPDWNETERRVWEEFKIIQSMEAKENNKGQSECDQMKIEAEWRVRRSKDGKHVYIKKTNSSRTRMLKEREKQIDMERCGVTTDDDAFTVYQGQYWNRDQRRRQLNRHNDRRKRLTAKAAEKAQYENKTEKVIAEHVQRKMTLPGKVFDNFVTVEEILSQRNRSGIFEGPVHVTTI